MAAQISSPGAQRLLLSLLPISRSRSAQVLLPRVIVAARRPRSCVKTVPHHSLPRSLRRGRLSLRPLSFCPGPRISRPAPTPPPAYRPPIAAPARASMCPPPHSLGGCCHVTAAAAFPCVLPVMLADLSNTFHTDAMLMQRVAALLIPGPLFTLRECSTSKLYLASSSVPLSGSGIGPGSCNALLKSQMSDFTPSGDTWRGRAREARHRRIVARIVARADEGVDNYSARRAGVRARAPPFAAAARIHCEVKGGGSAHASPARRRLRQPRGPAAVKPSREEEG
ncbi:hypothetical protein B0H15DRAFT_955420 [Mycena belliarum]|uniref:Uncharacterized protein n=1 Tax=Mycena belliarum TaxID=1033014 RepID=A0AAD6TWF8_9AGAR|nr:hypothetical protein B0H15DRAFT_955420 [Mycena belliae]